MNTTDELDAFFEHVPEHVLSSSTRRTSSTSTGPTIPTPSSEYLKAGRRVAVLRTFSKIYGLAGLRVGYAVAPPDVCAAMAKVRRPFDVTTPAQARGARQHRRTTPSSRAAAPSTRTASPGSRRSSATTASIRHPRVGNFVFAETGEDAPRSSTACCARA